MLFICNKSDRYSFRMRSSLSTAYGWHTIYLVSQNAELHVCTAHHVGHSWCTIGNDVVHMVLHVVVVYLILKVLGGSLLSLLLTWAVAMVSCHGHIVFCGWKLGMA